MKNIYLVTLILFTFNFLSCKKDGCRDKDAVNYCKDCKDGGGCQFEGKLVFWYDESTVKELFNQGVTGTSVFRYFIDGDLVGSAPANIYWTGPPPCGQNNAVTAKMSLGSNKTKTVTVRIIDENDQMVWFFDVELQANQCLSAWLRK